MRNSLKILNINTLLNPTTGGGTAERTIQMSRYLSFEKGIDVSILTLDLDLYSKIYNSSNPFQFMENISISGKTNFFEKRVSEYRMTKANKAPEDLEFSLDAQF